MLFGIENSCHLAISEDAFCYNLLSSLLMFLSFFFFFPGFYSCQSLLPLGCAVQGRNLGMLGKNRVSEQSQEQSACSKWTFS